MTQPRATQAVIAAPKTPRGAVASVWKDPQPCLKTSSEGESTTSFNRSFLQLHLFPIKNPPLSFHLNLLSCRLQTLAHGLPCPAGFKSHRLSTISSLQTYLYISIHLALHCAWDKLKRLCFSSLSLCGRRSRPQIPLGARFLNSFQRLNRLYDVWTPVLDRVFP